MKPVALQLYSLREEAKSDFVGVLKTVADIGYVGVETAGLHDMSAAEVRKVLDDLGLVCCSTHGALPTKETVGQRVDEAGALGTDMLISGLGPKQFESAEAQKESFNALNQAAGVCADAGVKFGYHNHWWEFDEVDGALPYEAMLQAVSGMFSQLDVYWAANFGAVDVPAVLARHAARVPVLHIKDGPLGRGEPLRLDRHAPAGGVGDDDGTVAELELGLVQPAGPAVGLDGELHVRPGVGNGGQHVDGEHADHGQGGRVRHAGHASLGGHGGHAEGAAEAADENLLEWLVVELDECATDMTQAVRESCKYLVGEGLARGK